MLKSKFQFKSQLLVEKPFTLLHYYIYIEEFFITCIGQNQLKKEIEFIATYQSNKNNWEKSILELNNYIQFNYSENTQFTFVLNVQNFIITKKYPPEIEEDIAIKNEMSLFNIFQKTETVFKENFKDDLIIASIVDENLLSLIKNNYVNATIVSDLKLHINSSYNIQFEHRIECCFFNTDCIIKLYKNNALQYVQKISKKDVYQIVYLIHQATKLYEIDIEITQFLYGGFFEAEDKILPILKSFYPHFSMLNCTDLQTLQVNIDKEILPYYLTPYLYI